MHAVGPRIRSQFLSFPSAFICGHNSFLVLLGRLNPACGLSAFLGKMKESFSRTGIISVAYLRLRRPDRAPLQLEDGDRVPMGGNLVGDERTVETLVLKETSCSMSDPCCVNSREWKLRFWRKAR